MASKNSPSAVPSAPRAESSEVSTARGRVGRIARFAVQLDTIIEGRDDSAPCALARAAAVPAARTLGSAWAVLDDHETRDRHEPPANRVLLPAGALPPVV